MTGIAPTLHFPPTSRRPRDDEIDVYGLTNRGKVRPDNQDHFLIGQLRGRLEVKASSLPSTQRLPLEEERVGSFMIVADGVGGGHKGERASRIALEEVALYINEAARCYYRASDSDGDFVQALERTARKVHEAVVDQAACDPGSEGMATTLTLLICGCERTSRTASSGGWLSRFKTAIASPPAICRPTVIWAMLT